MAFLTNISALKSLGTLFKSLLFLDHCILCYLGDPHTPDSFAPFEIEGYGIQSDRMDRKRTG
jgi:hypothetical protein